MIKIYAHRVRVEATSEHLRQPLLVEIEDSQNEARFLAIQQFLKSLEPADQRTQAQCDEYINWLGGWLGR